MVVIVVVLVDGEAVEVLDDAIVLLVGEAELLVVGDPVFVVISEVPVGAELLEVGVSVVVEHPW